METMKTRAIQSPNLTVILLLSLFLLIQGSVVLALTPEEIAQTALASTVFISMTNSTGQSYIGSGFVIGEGGQIATNYHVIEGIVTGTVKLVGETTAHPIDQVIAVDKARDLAIIEAAGLAAPALTLGDSDNVQIGQAVYAVGNPRGLTGTFSSGIVSAIRPEGNVLVAGTVIQITAPISPGSSGGPVLDSNAEVIGIAVGQHTGGQNLNFAIPVNYLKDLLTKPSDVPVSINDAPIQGPTVPRTPSFSDLRAAFDAFDASLTVELLLAAPELCVGLQFPRDTFAKRIFRNRAGETEDILVFAHRSDGRGVGWLILSNVIETSSSRIAGDTFSFVKRGDVWVLTQFEGLPQCAPVGKPDLVVQSPQVSQSMLEPDTDFTLSVTVKNGGARRAAATTLRYYRSNDSRISRSDTAVGTDPVGALGANRSSDERITLTAPSTPGTYYYGACVDSVSDESNTLNNCSTAVSITVERSPPEPTTLEYVSGDNQRGLTGETLIQPFVVKVHDQYDDPMEGVTVTFAVSIGGGSLSETSVDTDANGIAQSSLTLGIDAGTNTVEARVAGIGSVVMFTAVAELLEFILSMPAGISLIHVPLNVTRVDGVAKTIESIADLYDVLGGADTVNFLITYDSQAQGWRSYFGHSDTDRQLTDDMGIIVGLTAPTSVHLQGRALGTNGSSTVTLNPGLNVVGLPLNDSRINRVSDLLRLDGIWGNVPVIILTDGGEFKLVGRTGDPGDIEITGGQAFIMTASQEVAVNISGDAWTNGSGTVAAPSMALTGIKVGNATPVLGLRGSIVDEGIGLNNAGLRVTVKNLSTGRTVAAITSPDAAGYRSTVVDIETGRAATVGDVLEISARSPNPFVGVEPLWYTITTEDVKRSFIQLPELVAYEIPAETQLLANYPNPFNPETWIPYHLAQPADVTLTIYDTTGVMVRQLDLGHQPTGYYTDKTQAAYWDGRNSLGETVGSGVYFYHLSAGEYSATRKLVILK